MMDNMTPVVKQLLLINILCFLGTLLVPNAENILAMYYFENDNFRIWQPITHMFMHAGIAHIAFNMFALVSFGSLLEHYWGVKRFLIFYFFCGLGAALIHTAVNYYQIYSILESVNNLNLSKLEALTILNADYKQIFDENGQMVAGNIKSILDRKHCTQEQFNVLMGAIGDFQTPVVGASGAIYGLLIAFAFMFPEAQLSMFFIPVPIKAKYFVPMIVAFDLFSGITGTGGNVANFAHVGGALFGFILMMYWRNKKFNHKRWN